jgi:hypothetical protein
MTSSLGLMWNSLRYSRPRARKPIDSESCHHQDPPAALAQRSGLRAKIDDRHLKHAAAPLPVARV